MIATGIILSLLAAPWISDAIPGLRVGPSRPIGGVPMPNWRNADIDADGAMDLLFQDHALLQRERRFPEAARIALPDVPGAIALDVWEGLLYVRLLHRLDVYRWNGAWERTHSQELAWPDLDSVYEVGPGLKRYGALRLETFLTDLDADNYPEIVVADRLAMHCFRRAETDFVKAGEWALYPPLQLTTVNSRAIWPAAERRLMLPVRQMACTVSLDRQQVFVVHREAEEEGARYVRTAYTLAQGEAGKLSLNTGLQEKSVVVPEHLKPARLNNDATMDFAGGRWELSLTSPLPTPIFETWASIDGGASYTVKRVACLQSFRPHCSIIDFDGDGLSDLVTEGVGWEGGGPRETLNQVLLATSLSHIVRVYRQRDGAFSERADYTAHVEVQLGFPILRGGPRLLQYQAGELVNITGDLDGDGVRDLCVRTDDLTVQVIPTVRDAETLRPDWEAAEILPELSPLATLRIADVDGDGRSDVIAQSLSPGGAESGVATRVHFNTQGGR